ncbi:MAG: hypothetical protein NC084_12880 [Bacteroides sp.]|nr:hypothetical protein [Eubacterium sp.]MCM1419568.1 hypothetical protein [Roseburia sp.]MCM1463589.1 hypothetical protein [Bacteroides sp.]
MLRLERTRKYLDTLELVRNGVTVKRLDIVFDPDAAANEFSALYERLIRTQKALIRYQKTGDARKLRETAESFGVLFTDLLSLTFGKHNAAVVLDFYENDYLEMLTTIMPYLRVVILPKIGEALKREKNRLRQFYRR